MNQRFSGGFQRPNQTCEDSESLTEVVGDLVGAVSKHPEEKALSVANSLAAFIHSGCDEDTSSVPALHEHITRHRHVLPAWEEEEETLAMVDVS